LRAIIESEETLSSVIGFDFFDSFWVSSSLLEEINGYFIDWEETSSGTIFRSHVCNGSSISEGETLDTRSKEFYEFSDDTSLSENLSDSKNEISCSSSLGEFASQFETNDFGENHRRAFAEHVRFSFNATNTPTENTETIDHGSVGISSNDGVRIDDAVLVSEDTSSEVFEVDLMDDT
jgi:hypothetical protein